MSEDPGSGMANGAGTQGAFLARCLWLDLEIGRDGKLHHVGAILRGQELEVRGRQRPERVLPQLELLAASAEMLFGHNFFEHDLVYLRSVAPASPLLAMPVVDTLYLSALAFPEHPYHHLVKDYKLVRSTLGDPLADCRLAAEVFGDQWEALCQLGKSGRGWLTSFYHFCFAGGDAPTPLERGLSEAFTAMGAPALSLAEAQERWCAQTERACQSGLAELAPRLAAPQERAAFAFAVAWLQVAGSASVLPPWVRHRFPVLAPMLKRLRQHPCGHASCDFCRQTHDPDAMLVRVFGLPGFRAHPATPEGASLQREIVLAGLQDRSLLAILPTGGGKSLCYQLPALARHRARGLLTLVISPLQALMKDQVDNLVARTGTHQAAALSGLLTPPERTMVLERVRMGDVAILYVSPEQLRNRSFTKAIEAREIGAWVFDEAHCLSKWGHDFRPDYLYAGRYIRELAARQSLPAPPVFCFTATAKEDVKDEILDYFRAELDCELHVFASGVERENLNFAVHAVGSAEKFPALLGLLHQQLPVGGSGIVYASRRQGTEDIAAYLREHGIEALHFHAGMEPPDKRRVQEQFLSGEVRVICATSAFGMGVDKENVRLVVHADVPGSLESYLQEAGRAGRDQDPADCVLLYDPADIETQFRMDAANALTSRDLSHVLAALRRARRPGADELVITTGELAHSEAMVGTFDPDDRQTTTKIRTAVAWLERAGFLERNENHTRVFQGRPVVRSLEEAARRLEALSLSDSARARWLALLQTLMHADTATGISADELAALPQFADVPGWQERTHMVLRILQEMVEAGLLASGMLLSAYVCASGSHSAAAKLQAVSEVERALLALLPELSPEAEDGDWVWLNLPALNERLLQEEVKSNPELLRRLLASLAQDGRGLAASRGSMELRHEGRNRYRVKLQRSWKMLCEVAALRRDVAALAARVIAAKVPASAPVGAECLVEFALEDILNALKQELYLGPAVRDPLAAAERALLYLHEQNVITLQHGLAVFRQAMTIKMLPQPKGRRYGAGDYSPLAHHYRERIFQTHVMNEYATLGLAKIRDALSLVREYFVAGKADFVARFFPGRKQMLERATTRESYKQIVDDLGNPVQKAIVAASENENMLVLAGPGSGKTRVVVHRLAYLLRVSRVPPDAILAVCFNRAAALAIRRRLRQLVGDDAIGVTIQTYHGLALRLTGRSLAVQSERGGAAKIDLDELIPAAIQLLQGTAETVGLEPDELRDRLLAGYRHILVDEYQDVSAPHYELISALAGRTLEDPDRKLTILAVGDDDQNIYGWAGADLAYLRRFRTDYDARVHHLLENYRSTRRIVEASAAVVAACGARMKADEVLVVDRKRRRQPAGGRFEKLDALGSEGRVQVLECRDLGAQAAAIVAEMRRLSALDGSAQLADFAVLARTRDVLANVRAVCEAAAMPIRWGLERGSVPLAQVREVHALVDWVKSHRGRSLDSAELHEWVAAAATRFPDTSWRRLAFELAGGWLAEAGEGAVPASLALDWLHETLNDARREASIGDGVFLGTVHAAKGLEFAHVFVPDGGWSHPREKGRLEEERRVYYVAMTRAMQTLTLFRVGGLRNPHAGLVAARPESLVLPARLGALLPTELERRQYATLDPSDLFLSWAGVFPPDHQVHRELAALREGSTLSLEAAGDNVYALSAAGTRVAALSQKARAHWQARLAAIIEVRVLALLRREAADAPPELAPNLRSTSWETPLLEIVTAAPVPGVP